MKSIHKVTGIPESTIRAWGKKERATLKSKKKFRRNSNTQFGHLPDELYDDDFDVRALTRFLKDHGHPGKSKDASHYEQDEYIEGLLESLDFLS
ncbi:hypothetical protein OZX57_02210 [Bifidobacterium sp. ESL0682]|uniref:hypothetical protein n=1 Tax=Bifidobacterium sp. ESL0682 TaxID=2983212 RepID=UPI0023F762D3|nr:hypothetical protein [Bifidobacterium sp. ESL0682]WEV42309.1 hypothetical protein OZX57_02210 [Bifidobacterium sp. ESL0682]